MAFGNKDLMTKVLPHGVIDAAQVAKFCALRTFICRWPTFCGVSCPRFFSYCAGCSLLVTDITGGGCRLTNSCGAGGSACDPTAYCIDPVEPAHAQHAFDAFAQQAKMAYDKYARGGIVRDRDVAGGERADRRMLPVGSIVSRHRLHMPVLTHLERIGGDPLEVLPLVYLLR